MDSIKESERVAPRITILDAGELDKAIFDILKSQTNLISNYLPAWLLNNYSLEIDTVLRFGIWKLSVEKNRATFGQQLLRLKYSQNSKILNLRLLGLITIGGPYLKERFINSTYTSQSRKVGELFETIESSIKVLNILTFLRFLWRGGAPTFLELILQLNPVSTIPQSRRNVGYSYMTRELIWHGFIELLVILLPLINYHRLRRKVKNIFSGINSKPVQSKSCVFSSTSLCEHCQEPPILPHHMGCAHVFCYLCLASNHAADRMFECPGCGFTNPDVNAIKPIQLTAGVYESSREINQVVS